MPQLTVLERDLDICRAVWGSPDGREQTPAIETIMTHEEIVGWLNGEDPPRPFGVSPKWVHISSRLERIFTNGFQDVGPNEMGDVSGYSEGGGWAPEIIKAVIQEPGDKPVEVWLNGRESAQPVEAVGKANNGKQPSYTIIKGVATKVGER